MVEIRIVQPRQNRPAHTKQEPCCICLGSFYCAPRPGVLGFGPSELGLQLWIFSSRLSDVDFERSDRFDLGFVRCGQHSI